MKLIITSTDKDVTISLKSDIVFAKNQIQFVVNKEGVSFLTIFRERYEFAFEDITVNGEQLTASNAKALLSYALFREASGDTNPGPGGDSSNWEQITW